MLTFLYVAIAPLFSLELESNYMLYLFLFNLTIALPICFFSEFDGKFLIDAFKEGGFKAFMHELLDADRLAIIFSLMGFVFMLLCQVGIISAKKLVILNCISAILAGFCLIDNPPFVAMYGTSIVLASLLAFVFPLKYLFLV